MIEPDHLMAAIIPRFVYDPHSTLGAVQHDFERECAQLTVNDGGYSN